MVKPLDYTTVKWYCPQCTGKVRYVGYTAFVCDNCNRGWTLRRHDTLEELEEKNKKVSLHEDQYL